MSGRTARLLVIASPAAPGVAIQLDRFVATPQPNGILVERIILNPPGLGGQRSSERRVRDNAPYPLNLRP